MKNSFQRQSLFLRVETDFLASGNDTDIFQGVTILTDIFQGVLHPG